MYNNGQRPKLVPHYRVGMLAGAEQARAPLPKKPECMLRKGGN